MITHSRVGIESPYAAEGKVRNDARTSASGRPFKSSLRAKYNADPPASGPPLRRPLRHASLPSSRASYIERVTNLLSTRVQQAGKATRPSDRIAPPATASSSAPPAAPRTLVDKIASATSTPTPSRPIVDLSCAKTTLSLGSARSETRKRVRHFTEAQRALRAAQERDRRVMQRFSQLATVTTAIAKKHFISDETSQEALAAIEYELLPEDLSTDSNASLTALAGLSDDTSSSLNHNLTLLDAATSSVILQRISPTSLKKKSKAQQSALVGRVFLDAYLEKKQQSASSAEGKRGSDEHHLGIWHSTGNNSLDFTGETRCKGYRDEALTLLMWARTHCDAHLTPMRHLIHPSFHANLSCRAGKPFDWLTSFFGSDSMHYIHSWFTTVAFFTGFSTGAHTDSFDQVPSFLFNFGAAALLELPEFGVRITLEPQDLVVLNSALFYHRTQPVTGDADVAQQRWAFSAFFRTSIFTMRPTSRVNRADLVDVRQTWDARVADAQRHSSIRKFKSQHSMSSSLS